MQNYVFKIFRYDPNKDDKPRFDTFEVPKLSTIVTVLDALNYIKQNLDSTISYRHSCRMAICGSCAMRVNGRPSLACITKLKTLNTDEIKLEPLKKYEIIKDLVVDLEPFFEKHKQIKPYLITKEDIRELEPFEELKQKPKELEKYLQFAYCIKCGNCYSICPTTPPLKKNSKGFLGPQALAQSFRYCIDSRDSGLNERLDVIDSPEGVWRCHFAGVCSDVCGKGCDPALAIQLLRRLLIFGK